MNYWEENKQGDDSFSRGVGISLGLHVLIFLVFVVKAVFYTSPAIDFSQAIRVDVVGLPSKVMKDEAVSEKTESAKTEVTEEQVEKKPELPPSIQRATTAPVPVVKPEVKISKSSDGIKLEKINSTQQQAIDKMKSIAALEKIQNDVQKEHLKQLESKGKRQDGSIKVRGNVLAPGTALTGLAKLQHDKYASDLDHHIKEHWSLPEWLSKRDLAAQVKVYFDERGNIIRRKIVKSSGNQSYDEEVLATIDRSAPFPAPPEKFISMVEVDGILIGFPE